MEEFCREDVFLDVAEKEIISYILQTFGIEINGKWMCYQIKSNAK